MKLYRKFRVDPSRKPLVGTGFGMLGVRPFDPSKPRKVFDVRAVTGSDPVMPGGGGLSVYSEPAAILVQAANLILFEIDSALLPGGLISVPSGVPPYVIEPSVPMTLDDFQVLLAGTLDDWQPV